MKAKLKELLEAAKRKVSWLVGAVGAAGAALLILSEQPASAGTYYPGQTGLVIDSTVGNTNANSYATNGVYPNAIASNTTCSNLVCLNPNNASGNTLLINLQAQAMASTTTNVVVVLTSTPRSVTITNITATGSGQATQPRTTLLTATLALNGTTPVSTNIVLSPSSTPPFTAGMKVYVETIGMGISSENWLTNFSVFSSQN